MGSFGLWFVVRNFHGIREDKVPGAPCFNCVWRELARWQLTQSIINRLADPIVIAIDNSSSSVSFTECFQRCIEIECRFEHVDNLLECLIQVESPKDLFHLRILLEQMLI